MVFVADDLAEFMAFGNDIADQPLGPSVGFYVEQVDSLYDMPVLSFKELAE